MLQAFRNWAGIQQPNPIPRQGQQYDDALEQAIAASLRSHQTERAAQRARALAAARITSNQSLMEWSPAYIQSGVGGGLFNLGNACFMNATLQCLTYLPPFVQSLAQSSHSSHCETKGFCLLCECEQLLPQLILGKGGVFYPTEIFANLSEISVTLQPEQQQDAHEFLQHALDKMETALDIQNDEEFKSTNFIRKFFQGSTKSSIECLNCQNVSTREEPFLCLSVDVANTFEQALRSFAQSERMFGKDAYDCDVCQSKQEAVRETFLGRLPPVFAVHLKRFQTIFQEDGTMETLKDRAHVSFPFDFDVDPKMVYSGESGIFELCGVIVHRGDHAHGGHYYSVVKGCDGFWCRMDDDRVIRMTPGEVLSEQAYVLFYKRVDWQPDENEPSHGVDDNDDDDDVKEIEDEGSSSESDESEESDVDMSTDEAFEDSDGWVGLPSASDIPWKPNEWVS